MITWTAHHIHRLSDYGVLVDMRDRAPLDRATTPTDLDNSPEAVVMAYRDALKWHEREQVTANAAGYSATPPLPLFGLRISSLRIAPAASHKTTTALRIVVFLLSALAIFGVVLFASPANFISESLNHRPEIAEVTNSSIHTAAVYVQTPADRDGSLSIASALNIFMDESINLARHERCAKIDGGYEWSSAPTPFISVDVSRRFIGFIFGSNAASRTGSLNVLSRHSSLTHFLSVGIDNYRPESVIGQQPNISHTVASALLSSLGFIEFGRNVNAVRDSSFTVASSDTRRYAIY